MSRQGRGTIRTALGWLMSPLVPTLLEDLDHQVLFLRIFRQDPTHVRDQNTIHLGARGAQRTSILTRESLRLPA
jgi:hypothetical protein